MRGSMSTSHSAARMRATHEHTAKISCGAGRRELNVGIAIRLRVEERRSGSSARTRSQTRTETICAAGNSGEPGQRSDSRGRLPSGLTPNSTCRSSTPVITSSSLKMRPVPERVERLHAEGRRVPSAHRIAGNVVGPNNEIVHLMIVVDGSRRIAIDEQELGAAARVAHRVDLEAVCFCDGLLRGHASRSSEYLRRPALVPDRRCSSRSASDRGRTCCLSLARASTRQRPKFTPHAWAPGGSPLTRDGERTAWQQRKLAQRRRRCGDGARIPAANEPDRVRRLREPVEPRHLDDRARSPRTPFAPAPATARPARSRDTPRATPRAPEPPQTP